MKNLLYISSCDPDYSNGGAIGTKKITKTLDTLANEGYSKTYMLLSSETRKSNTEFVYNFQRKKWKALLCRLFGYGDQLEFHIKDAIKLIEKENIEIVIIQSSRLGNFTKKIRQRFPKIKIIQNFDNFEYKFATLFTKEMNVLIQTIEKINVKKAEINAINYSEKMIFLTNKDKQDVFDFYKVSNKDYEIIPLIYSDPIKNKKMQINKKNQIIFTGTLDMLPNINSAKFLIDNFDKIKETTGIKTLIIAGRNPRIDLLEVKREDIKIIANPSKEEMEKLLLESKIYVSPVFEGSGMKTKFLEAIAYGLPILASEHTMIGYDTFDRSTINFVEVFNDFDIEDFIKKLQEIYGSYKEYNIEDYEEIRNFFVNEFSEGKVVEKIKNIIMEL